mgnify:CR=1 FL=1
MSIRCGLKFYTFSLVEKLRQYDILSIINNNALVNHLSSIMICWVIKVHRKHHLVYYGLEQPSMRPVMTTIHQLLAFLYKEIILQAFDYLWMYYQYTFLTFPAVIHLPLALFIYLKREMSDNWRFCTFMYFIMPPRSKIRGHIVFVLSVILSETLTLLITFEQWMLELWYFTWVFLVIRLFRGYHYFWPCDIDLGVWPIFWKL